MGSVAGSVTGRPVTGWAPPAAKVPARLARAIAAGEGAGVYIASDPDSPVIFNLRLGDGMIDGGQVEAIAIEAPLAAIASQDDEEPG